MSNSKKLIKSCCEGISHIPEIKEVLPSDESLIQISYIFKALNDPTRLKMLYALLDYEICVGEMSNLLEIPQSHVSHQFRILKKYGIVDFRKEKKMSFYHIKNEYIEELLNMILKNVKE